MGEGLCNRGKSECKPEINFLNFVIVPFFLSAPFTPQILAKQSKME